jgi:acyl-CoA synthetase (AMP-forming)/AMP-acid ligase II
VVAAEIADRSDVAQAMTAHAITHVTLLPLQLKQLLDGLPRGFERPASLTIYVQGSSISEALHERALRFLATEVCTGYGCNEASNLSFTREIRKDGSAGVCPDVQIEVIDERERPVPQGEIGKIRIRTESMVDGYIDDPETTRRMFRDGWFYPGDVGVFVGPRQLRIVGRVDDLINLGGTKFSPSELEDIVQASVKVADAGVCGMRNADGFDEICVALVRPEHTDEELLRLISSEFQRRQAGDFVVVKLARIPRNPNGKVQRDLLKQMIAAARG